MPISTVIGPMIDQVVVWLIGLPSRTPNPCSAQIRPNTATSKPTANVATNVRFIQGCYDRAAPVSSSPKTPQEAGSGVRVATKNPAQRLRHPCAYRCTRDDHVDHRQRLVGVAAGTDMFRRYARRIERGGVGLAVVAQRIELGRHHDRRRQPGQIGGT